VPRFLLRKNIGKINPTITSTHKIIAIMVIIMMMAVTTIDIVRLISTIVIIIQNMNAIIISGHGNSTGKHIGIVGTAVMIQDGTGNIAPTIRTAGITGRNCQKLSVYAALIGGVG